MSLVNFKARNHPQQAVRDAVDDRRTPLSVFGPLDASHSFTLDAAASPENAKCPKFYTRDTDGLLRSWSGERVWCNPPFSRLEPWLAKAWREMHDACELVVMLLPANRCEQGFWQRWVEPFRDKAPVDGVRLTSRFLKERTRFSSPGQIIPKKGDRPPFGCVLLTWERVATKCEQCDGTGTLWYLGTRFADCRVCCGSGRAPMPAADGAA
jgi:phage N-6-adenine-methyltransferase